MTRPLRLGTRGSVLARTQSGHVADAVASLLGQTRAASVTEVIIRTQGDDTTTPLNESKTPGLFVNALRDALLAGEVDFIVHSFKDLPSGPVAGITVAAVPVREDIHDVLVSRENLRLSELPAGAVVGTSSPRRAARILSARPDLLVRPIRGNIDTRIAKVRDGEFDATVLAAAGLNRVGRQDEIAEVLDLKLMLPAPAQGALAVECRSDDDTTLALLQQLDDPATRLITTAERALLVGLAATCSTAIGAVAQISDGNLTVTAELSDPTNSTVERLIVEATLPGVGDVSSAESAAHQLGMYAAQQLLTTDLGVRVARQIQAERGNG